MEALRYRDFELEIGRGRDGYYPVTVLRSPAGSARGLMAFPSDHRLDRQARYQQLSRLEGAILGAEGADAGQEAARKFGAQLFEVLFQDDVGAAFDSSRQAALEGGQGLRIKLRVNDPDLATLPWEFLFDPRRDEFVALSRHTPIVRYLELPLPQADLRVEPPLRILAMVTNPTDVPPLDVEREKARLEDALAEMPDQEDRIELVWLEGQTWRELQEAMQRGPWHVFHFIGHAAFDSEASEGTLILADDQGNATSLSAGQLGRLLGDQPTLRLAVLNACEGARGDEQSLFSSAAGALVERGMPAVIAMQYGISDRAAVEFAGSLYGALAANLPIDAAVSEARKAIDLALHGSVEWGTPVLYTRAPDGVIWDVKPPRRLPRLLVAAVAAVAVLLVGLLAFIAWSVAAPEPQAKMKGEFRVAIADFAAIDPDTGEARRSEEGEVLSQWLAEGLSQVSEEHRNEPLLSGVEVWHDSLEDTSQNFDLDYVAGASEAEREATAAELAQSIEAHMIVYGNLVPHAAGEPGASDEVTSSDTGPQPDRRLELDFYLSPLLAGEGVLVVGSHALGQPLSVPEPFEPASNPLANRVIGSRLDARAEAIFWLMIGLTYDLLGDHESALQTFTQADEQLARHSDQSAQAILEFFTGRQEFVLAQDALQDLNEAQEQGRQEEAAQARERLFQRLDEAAASFQEAMDGDPANARAQAALASTLRKRVEVTLQQPTGQLSEMEALQEGRALLEQALVAQRDAVAQAQATADPVSEAAGRIALAKTLDLKGETHYLVNEYDQAESLFREAIEQVDSAITLLSAAAQGETAGAQTRLVSQAFEAQGAAHRYLAAGFMERQRWDEAGRELEDARAAYEGCLAQGDAAPLDQFLQDIVIGEGCRPQLQGTLQALEELKEARS